MMKTDVSEFIGDKESEVMSETQGIANVFNKSAEDSIIEDINDDDVYPAQDGKKYMSNIEDNLSTGASSANEQASPAQDGKKIHV